MKGFAWVVGAGSQQVPALLRLPFTGENGGQTSLAVSMGAPREGGKAQQRRCWAPDTSSQRRAAEEALPVATVGLRGEQGSVGISSQLSSDVNGRA